MQTIVIQREPCTDTGTFGVLTLPDGWSCHTLELPWRENRRTLSCIPAGRYDLVAHTSPRFGRTYWVRNVPDRSEILIHAGNLAGDKKLGYRTDVEGCILLGEARGVLSRQPAVLSSKPALKEFLRRTAFKPLVLEVHDA